MLLALLLPVFLVTGIGCVLARTRLLAPGWQIGLTDLTAKLLLPAFLFGGTYRTGLPATVSLPFLAAFFVPLLALFALTMFALRRDGGGAARAVASTYSNTVFVGIPVLSQAFGADSLQYAFPVIAFHGLALFSMYYLSAQGGRRIGAALLSAVSNPIVASLLAGLALHHAHVALPAALVSVLAMLSAAALPCALLALGASLAGFRLQAIPATLAIVAVKLLVLPAAVLAMSLACGLPAPAAAVLVVIASCPVGVNAAALVQANQDATLVSSAILLSSVLCAASIPFWISIVRSL